MAARLDRCIETLDATIETQRDTRRLAIGGGEVWFWLFVVPAAALCGAFMAWSAT